MAYADQESMSSRKIVSIVLVALLHALLGYAFITGLAFNVVKKVAADLKTFDVVEEPPPPEEEPPPPPPDQPQVEVPPPPMVTPPPVVQIQTPPVMQMQTVNTIPPVTNITPLPPTTAPPAPARPAVTQASGPRPRGNEGDWVRPEDYPSRAEREEKEGVVRISFTVGADGRVTGCSVTATSGVPELDNATCPNFSRRARYTPAKDPAGNNIPSTLTKGVRWTLPEN